MDRSTSRTITVNEQFQVSRQFWAHAVENGVLDDPKDFVNRFRVSFDAWERQCDLPAQNCRSAARRPAVSRHGVHRRPRRVHPQASADGQRPRFQRSHRVELNPRAARTSTSGALTKQYLNYLSSIGAKVYFGHDVRSPEEAVRRQLESQGRQQPRRVPRSINAKFVFVGAGGGATTPAEGEASKKPRASAASGRRCVLRSTSELIAQHGAKVYGKAAVSADVGSSPRHPRDRQEAWPAVRSVRRTGRQVPQGGSNTDLFRSIRANSTTSLIGVGLTELGLTKYLVSELLASRREEGPHAVEFVAGTGLITAGQRVQVIRKGVGGVLGSARRSPRSEDGSIADLLGASPSASTAVTAMLDVMKSCFSEGVQRLGASSRK